MREEAARFESAQKIFGRGLVPFTHGFGFRQAIISAVHLDGVEDRGIMREHFGIGKFIGIKIALPMVVVPAGSADAYRRAHTCSWRMNPSRGLQYLNGGIGTGMGKISLDNPDSDSTADKWIFSTG